jgi:hypothetical protein
MQNQDSFDLKGDTWQPCETGLLSSHSKSPTNVGFAAAMARRPLAAGVMAGAILSASVSVYVGTRNDKPVAVTATANPVAATGSPVEATGSLVEATGGLATLTCGQVATALAARRQGPLETTLHKRVTKHLVSCNHCRATLRQMQRKGQLPLDAFQLSRAEAPNCGPHWLLAVVAK